MARVISEIVEGMDLFVPSAGDFFSVNPGGLPNGDDSLIVHGDVSPNHWAFAKNPGGISPDIFGSASVWALTFWLKLGSTTGIQNRQIMGIQTYAARNTLVSTSRASTKPFVLGTLNSTASLNFSRGIGSTNNQVTSLSVSTTGMVGNWRFLTFNVAGIGENDAASYVNDSASAESTDTQSVSGGTPANDLFFSLGTYGGTIGMPVEYEIGKIAFHDHQLDYTERLLLWHAMVGP